MEEDKVPGKSELPWRRGKKPKKEKPFEEDIKSEVVPTLVEEQKQDEEIQPEKSELPWRRGKKPKTELQEVEDVVLKPVLRGKPKDTEEQEKIKLKPIPKDISESAQPEVVTLKPIPKREKPEKEREEVSPETLKPVKLSETPVEEEKPAEKSELPWRRGKKPKKEMPDSEEIKIKPGHGKIPDDTTEMEKISLKPIPKREKSEDKEEITLKPIPRKEKPEEEKEEITLKPIPRKEKPEEEKEEVKLKPIPRKEIPEENKEEIKLKRVPRKERPEDEKEEITLKPIPRKEKPEEEKEEVKLKPIPKKEIPEDRKEEIKLKRVPRKEKPEDEKEEITLKPVPRKEKPEEEREEVKLKPIPRKERPEEDKEEIKLKPVPRKETPEEDREEVKLKPVPRKDKPEDEKEELKLKRVPRKEKPEDEKEEKEDIKLKPIPRREKPEEEKEGVKLKPIPKKEVPLEEKEEVNLKPTVKKVEPKEEEKEKPEPVPVWLKEESKPEEGKISEKSELPWRKKKSKEPVPKPEKEIEKPETIPEAPKTVQIPVPEDEKPEETPEEKSQITWRRKRVMKPKKPEEIPQPVIEEVKPEDSVTPWRKTVVEPELKPVQLIDKEEKEYVEEKKSEAQMTLSTVQKQVIVKPKPDTASEEIKEIEEEQILWQKQIKVDTVSKKKIPEQKKVPIPEDDIPLRELEIITAKRVTEGVIRLPEEPVVEDVEVHEDTRTVRRSLVQRTAAEITTTSTKTVPPRFIQRLQPIAIEPNKIAVFTCKVEGYPFPELTWYRNGIEIQPTSRIVSKIFESTATLEISDVTPDDVGNYTCQASNPAGVASSTANLVVIEKEETGIAPHFVQPLKPLVVKPKEVATLQCTVRGTPTPTVKWYRSNKELKPGKSREISFIPETGVASLKILKPKEDDQTIYTVRAINTFGKAECRANLIVEESVVVHKPEVLEAPKITKPLQAKMVPTGDSTTLEVEFEGVPKPEVRWYRNGKEIVPTEKVQITIEDYKTTLHIPEVYRPEGGKYEVRAVNPAGEARTSGSVSVTTGPEPEMEEVIPPRFIKPLHPQIVAEGEVVIMETRVESHPTCSFQWFQHSVPIKSSPELRVVTTDNRSLLLVREILSEHAGIYTCRAENVAGSVTCTATVNVVTDSEWEEVTEFVSPSFVQRLTNVRVMDGEEVHFVCQVTGKPTPRISWFHKNEPVKEAKDVTIYQDTEGVCKLAISEVFPEDAGEYTCHAINKVGEAVCAASLIVEDSEIASVTIGTSLVMGQSGSEEDLLAEKETLSEVSEEKSDTELPEVDEKAPKFITPLQKIIPSRDGELVRLEVKVDGKPKPKVVWHKQGVEVIPSNDFQIEEFEDGTSVLTIPEVFPDDSGEITCTAENPLGVATSSSELVVDQIVGTKEYRKPEWVTHMEELQEALRGNNVVPSCMPEHGSSDNDVMSVDSLETGSVHRQHVRVSTARKRQECPVGSMNSLGDISIGDDSVFVSNASSCSDDLHSSKTVTVSKSTTHVTHLPVASKPFVLNPPQPSPEDCQLHVSLSPCVTVTSPDSNPINNVETGNVATGSDFAHLIITDYLNSHRLSITAAIEALDIDDTSKSETHETHVIEESEKLKPSVDKTPYSIESTDQSEELTSIERPILHLHQRKERSEEVVEIIYVSENEDNNKSHMSNSFYLLSPIQESSEPSTESSCNGGSNGVGNRRLDKHVPSNMKLLSASCEAISTTDSSMASDLQTKYQTFPRSKIPVLSPMRSNACYSVPEDPMMYPLEPRELDPAGFHQLHMADSQEELQEFLLLESQCMTTDGQGLAAAFIVSDEEPFHSDGDDHCTMSEVAEEEREQWKLQKAQEEKEKIKMERALLEKKRQERRQKKIVLYQEASEAQVLESTTQFSESTETATAQKVLTVHESVEVSAVGSSKKIDEQTTTVTTDTAERKSSIQEGVQVTETRAQEKTDDFRSKFFKLRSIAARPTAQVQLKPVTVTQVQPELKAKPFELKKVQKETKAQKVVTQQESVSVSQVTSQSTVKEFKEEKKKTEKAQRVMPVQESVTIEEIQSEATVKELQEKKPKVRRAKVEKKPVVKETAVVTEVKTLTAEQILEEQETKMATEVEELMKFVRAKEFGPGESPLRELAKIGFLVRQGVSVNEITTLYQADKFPALRSPEAQSAMVQLVEREGHGTLISQVLTEESTTDEALVAATVGFRAFMRMVELRHAAVEEVITHFAPEDFRSHAWETSEATQVVTQEFTTERVQVSEQAEVHVEERKVIKKTRKQETETEGLLKYIFFLM
ncbi:hypothetical protein C0J52_25667 [Blattella germanica]|nr:hypothetical protein C0J52_25667 [Blattella germanica]